MKFNAQQSGVVSLQADMRAFIVLHNKKTTPFKWTKSPGQILASVKRFHRKDQQTFMSRTLGSRDESAYPNGTERLCSGLGCGRKSLL
jgi:hypothetical protein